MSVMRRPLGIYLHIPFCKSKCGYCDFCSFPSVSGTDRSLYVWELVKDLRRWGEKIGADYTVDTVYFGGGTPTLLLPSEFEALLAALSDAFSVAPGAEITAECNPGSVDRDYLAALRASGVNRLSVGVQSAVDAELQALGRIHTFSRARETFADAHAVGFDNLSADLMFGIPLQTKESLSASLDAFCGLGIRHLSAYCLKIEPGTPFARMGNSLRVPDDDTDADMYEQIVETLRARGLERYEISNFCMPGFASVHNGKYWNCDDYLGLGVSAHSYLHGVRFAIARDLPAFLAGQRQETEHAEIDDNDRLCEYVMLRMRLAQGILLREAEERFPFCDFAARFRHRLQPYIDGGFVIWEQTESGIRCRFSEKGFFVSNTILSDVLDFDEPVSE